MSTRQSAYRPVLRAVAGEVALQMAMAIEDGSVERIQAVGSILSVFYRATDQAGYAKEPINQILTEELASFGIPKMVVELNFENEQEAAG